MQQQVQVSNVNAALAQLGIVPATGQSLINALTVNQNTVNSNTVSSNANAVNTDDGTGAVSEGYIAELAKLLKKGYALLRTEGMGRFNSRINLVRRPVDDRNRLTVHPTLFVVEEYRTASYLGDYGAGRTISTFSLLPGEKTIISVKTFKEISSTKASAENIMDSFSESSATEMENLIQEDTNMQKTRSDASDEASSKSKNKQSGVSASASGGFLGINLSASANHSVASNSAAARNHSTASSRSLNVEKVSKALEKHVENSNSNRQVNINTSTQDSYTESTETSVVRELTNPNQSRVLNFVFRQLLQQYVTITYLHDVKIAYSNGHPESFRLVSIQELDVLLEEVMATAADAQQVRDLLMCSYGTDCVSNYANVPKTFLELADIPSFNCKGALVKKIRKIANITDTYTNPGGGLGITVGGIILKVDKNTLRTDSVVADALMGQGDALDCFNSHVQEAKKNQLWLETEKTKLAIETLQAISDPALRAQMYAAMFNPPVATNNP